MTMGDLETAGPGGEPSEPERELAELATEIKADLRAAKESRWEELGRFRAAGEKLRRARVVCPHGEWEDWLRENFEMSDKTARRYIQFAETDVTSDLEEREKLWRRINGNPPRKGKRKRQEAAPEPEGMVVVLPYRAFVKTNLLARRSGRDPDVVVAEAVDEKYEREAPKWSKRSGSPG
jgi:hypothetical protein